jgi:soluble lytic murein transglycosylase-like protein
MQKRSRFPFNRLPFIVLATVFFLVISFNSTPSDPAIPAPQERPTANADEPQLQDLAHWLATGDGGNGSAPSGFHVFRPEDLSGGDRQHRLFEPGPDVDAQRRFLNGIPYGSVISRAAERHKIDGLLLAAMVAVESSFTPNAVSPRGACGLMQVTPEVGEAYGAQDLFDPYVNVDVGSRYLHSLLKDFDGDVEQALAAYNAGPAAVARYRGIPPYDETRSYVREVMERYARYTRQAERVSPVGVEPRVLRLGS